MEKELFISSLNTVRDQFDFDIEFADKMSSLFEDAFPTYYKHAALFDSIAELLSEGVENKVDTINWWMYELDFGRQYEEGCLSDKSGNIDVSTAEKLYEHLYA